MGSLRDVVSGKKLGNSGTINLRTLIDPADVMGGQAASDKLKAAEAASRSATMNAIRNREEMFRKSLEIGAPYRELGYAALPKLRESLQAGSPLDRLRSNLTKSFMSKYLQKQGFGGDVAENITGKRVSRTMAAEDVSRRGRARDLMALGAGQVAEGVGRAGAYGTSQARNVLAAGANQAELLAQQAQARQNMAAAALYGGQRLAGDYIAKREADRYGGY